MGRAEAYLNEIPMWTRKKNSLKDVRAFLERMGHPDRDIPAIHVAGTNGKGSVCAFLTSVLNQAGYKTGTFISPHLVEIRERFLINGQMAEEEAFEEAFSQVHDTVREMVKEGYCHPTFFEFLFYIAMVLFKNQAVEQMVIETGLGGRLDTTNVLEHPLASVITSISMDHTAYLGTTLEAIAGEKAGIIKRGVPVIFDDTSPEASAVIRKKAEQTGSPSYPVRREDCVPEGVKEGSLCVRTHLAEGIPVILEIPFEAWYQAQNAMLAVRTLDVLRSKRHQSEGAVLRREITDYHILEGIRKTRWPGRMEEVRPGVYLDGAHNPGGIEALIRTVEEIKKRRKKEACLLFAAVSDKDYEAMAERLCKDIRWCGIGVVHMNNDRGLSAGSLAETFKRYADCPVFPYEDSLLGLKDMRARAGSSLLFCAGSLYLIGEIKEILTGDQERQE